MPRELTDEEKIARRLRRIADDAKTLGLVLVADAEVMAIRVMTKEQERAADDLRRVGLIVPMHGGCGGGVIPRIDASGNG